MGKPSKVIRWAVWILALLWLVGNSPIWQMDLPRASLDASWKAVIHHAWTQPWLFGQDIIVSYGPYGWLVTDFVYPPTFWLDAVYRVVAVALSFAVIMRVASRTRMTMPMAALLAILLIETTRVYVDAYLYLLASLPLWIMWTATDKWQRADLVLLRLTMANLGLLVLVKHGFAAVAVSIFFLTVLHTWRGDRRVAWSLLTVAGTGVVAWFAAGQTLGNIADYMITAWAIVSAWTDAMALYSNRWSDAWVTIAAAGLMLTVIAALWTARPKTRIADILCMAAVVFIVFKGSVVRTDPGHTFIAAGIFPVWAALAVMITPRSRRAVGVAGLVLAVIASLMSSPRDAALRPFHQRWVTRWSGVGHRMLNAGRVLTDPGRIDSFHATAGDRFREALPLPPLPGAVDLTGGAQAALLATDLQYHPRPVFHSNMVYHPALQRINLEHLRSNAAPQWMVITTDGADNHYPTTEDGLLYPELLTRYRWQAPLPGGWQLLRRETHPRQYSHRSVLEQDVQIGRFINVPSVADGAAVWAKIDVQLNPLGRAISMLYKPPPIDVLIETAGGHRTRRRLIRSMGKAGFILSPMLRTPVSYAALATGQPRRINADNRVVRFAIVVGPDCGGERCVQRDVQVRLSELTWESPTE